MARHKVAPPAAAFFLLLTVSNLASFAGAQQMCDSREYQMCITLADPLIRNPKLVFPDTMADIDEVCRTWAKFVDCVKRYTDRCFSPTRRLQFNQAVQRSVDSVHQMCTQTPYQTEYLSHASCIKATLNSDCTRQYGRLADLVASTRPVTSRVHICCAHHEFRECVIRETKRRCDRDIAGPASRFALHILDKALSFLHEDCTNYIPMTGDCPTGDTPTDNQYQNDLGTTRKYPTPRGESSRVPFGRSSSRFPEAPPTPSTTERPVEFSMPGDTTSSSAAPWTPPPNPADVWTPGNGQLINEVPTTKRPFYQPSTEAPWGLGETSTRISWGDDNENYVHSTVSWYPEAAIHHNGIIDEPNQQGYKGAASALKPVGALLVLSMAPLVLRRLLS
ncbi:uncharacterized protein LOC132204360 isoform X2 [Neocloeon triangulifer]|uniref:uncharacterized protein LOC132204360 isoform X2 n=1 Tax=Neocloeon triangulifer TaxID=2078957 RepID=UPI00286EDA61|nr:uncharacterized protein LOC132204360 isoform X2 [Neocloeon triangulifer]